MATEIGKESDFCDFNFLRHLDAELPARGKVLTGGSAPGSELDTGLTKESQEKSLAIADKVAELPNIAALFSSPFRKTVETIQPISVKLQLPLQIVEKALEEQNHGALTGIQAWKDHPSWKEYSKLSRVEKIVSRQAEGSETNCEVIDRVRDFCLKTPPQYLGKSVVCCTHDGTMRSLLNLAAIEKIVGPLGNKSSTEAVREIEKGIKIEDAKHFAKGEIFHVRVYPLTGRIEIKNR
jgi:broad specificity phosphatase PhoE